MRPYDAILLLALLVAAVTDIRTRKIKNKLTVPLMAVGLVCNAVFADGLGLGAAFTGLGVAFALHFTLTVLGLEGAGDGKLMMGVGAFLGTDMMIEATLWRYVLVLPYAIVALTVTKRWASFTAAVRWVTLKVTQPGADVGPRPEPLLLPFGPVIAIAVPLAIQTTWLDW